MSNNIENLRDTIIPKGDQLNADQLLGGSITITVTSVERGNAEQPLVIHYVGEEGRPYKPCKSMRKVLIFAWGENGNDWVGKSITLYNKPDVKYGGVMVGGIRISHLSDIPADIQVSLTETRGKKTPCLIKRLEVSHCAVDVVAAKVLLDGAALISMPALKDAWDSLSKAEQKAVGKTYLDELKKRAIERTTQKESDDGDL